MAGCCPLVNGWTKPMLEHIDPLDEALARFSDIANRIADERNGLAAALKEMLAADDAMSAFIIAADPAKLGEKEWNRQHTERSARRRRATEAARAAVAKVRPPVA